MKRLLAGFVAGAVWFTFLSAAEARRLVWFDMPGSAFVLWLSAAAALSAAVVYLSWRLPATFTVGAIVAFALCIAWGFLTIAEPRQAAQETGLFIPVVFERGASSVSVWVAALALGATLAQRTRKPRGRAAD